PIWLIEAVPNDRYYLYGKLVFGIDRETYKVCNVVKYDWRGQAMGVFNRGIAFGRAPDGYRYVNITGGGRGGAYAENMKMRRTSGAPGGRPSPRRSRWGWRGRGRRRGARQLRGGGACGGVAGAPWRRSRPRAPARRAGSARPAAPLRLDLTPPRRAC